MKIGIEMKVKLLFLVFLMFTLMGCLGFKPFQPPPPQYKYWFKSGATQADVKKELLQCGYPSIYGFNNRSYIPNEVAIAEKCMFNKGFKHPDGYRGICSLDHRKNLPACHGRECSSREEDGCSPRNSLYTQYAKEGANESDVKAVMLKCGYPNVFDTNETYPDNEIAKRENCMYQNGFDYISGSGHKRLCAKPVMQSNLPYCPVDAISRP